jgi:hypothetical protein
MPTARPRTWRLLRTFIVGITVGVTLVAAIGARPAIADEERTLTTPTGWWWLYGVSESDINTFTAANNARVIDIDVSSTNPLRYAVTFVSNTGDYARTWWWYTNATSTDVSNLLAANNGRLIDLTRYFDPVLGQDRFVIVMVRNTGTAAKSWWYYYDQSVANIVNLCAANNARPVDIQRVPSTGNYDVIMISNTGADASAWWHYYNVDATTLVYYLDTNSARLIDLSVHDAAAGTYDAVMISNTGASAVNWWWYYGVTAAELSAYINQDGARIVDLETWVDGLGTRRFAAVLVNNSNALTTHIANILQYGSDGTSGLYLKQVGGPVLASLDQAFVFEPASSIKITVLTHGMRQVMLGLDNLNNNVTYSVNYNGTCPIAGPPNATQSLALTMRDMMWYSDNAATYGLCNRYGVANINNTAATVGLMTNTRINHTPIGCALPAVARPNQLTLQDAGMLYERIANGSIFDPATRTTLYSLMQSDTTPPASQWWFTISLHDIVYQEAANLGIPDAAPSYWNNTHLAWKPGGYTLCFPSCQDFVSVAGWVSLPNCGGQAVLTHDDYVFGAFVNGAALENGRVFNAAPELFRDLVRDGLLTCPTEAPEVPVVASKVHLSPNAPNPFNPSTTLSFSLEASAQVRLSILDVRGREVAVLVDAMEPAGTHAVRWDGRDVDGGTVASGAYMVRLIAGEDVATQKIVLAK